MAAAAKQTEEAEKHMSELHKLAQTQLFRELGKPLMERKEKKAIGSQSRAANAEAEIARLQDHAQSSVKPALVLAAIERVDAGLQVARTMRESVEMQVQVDTEVMRQFEERLRETRGRLEEGDYIAVDVAAFYCSLLKGYVEMRVTVQDAKGIEAKAGNLQSEAATQAITRRTEEVKRNAGEYGEKVRNFLKSPYGESAGELVEELDKLARTATVSLVKSDAFLGKSMEFEELNSRASLDLLKERNWHFGLLETMVRNRPKEQAEHARTREKFVSDLTHMLFEASKRLDDACESYNPEEFFRKDGKLDAESALLAPWKTAVSILGRSGEVRRATEEKTWHELFQQEKGERLGEIVERAGSGAMASMMMVDGTRVLALDERGEIIVGEDGKPKTVSLFEFIGEEKRAGKLWAKFREALGEVDAARKAFGEGKEAEAKKHLQRAAELDSEAQAILEEAMAKYRHVYEEERMYKGLNRGEKAAFLFTKYGTYVCDGIVIVAGVAAEVGSGGAATPAVLGLEAAYWSLRAGKDVYEDYQQTGEFSWAKVGQGALFAVPALGRFSKAYFEFTGATKLAVNVAIVGTDLGLGVYGVNALYETAKSGMRTGFTSEELAGFISGAVPVGLSLRGMVPAVAKWRKERLARMDFEGTQVEGKIPESRARRREERIKKQEEGRKKRDEMKVDTGRVEQEEVRASGARVDENDVKVVKTPIDRKGKPAKPLNKEQRKVIARVLREKYGVTKAEVVYIPGASGAWEVKTRNAEGEHTLYFKFQDLSTEEHAAKRATQLGLIVPEYHSGHYVSEGSLRNYGYSTSIGEMHGVKKAVPLYAVMEDAEIRAQIRRPGMRRELAKQLGEQHAISSMMGLGDYHRGNVFVLLMEDGSLKLGRVDLDDVHMYRSRIDEKGQLLRAEELEEAGRLLATCFKSLSVDMETMRGSSFEEAFAQGFRKGLETAMERAGVIRESIEGGIQDGLMIGSYSPGASVDSSYHTYNNKTGRKLENNRIQLDEGALEVFDYLMKKAKEDPESFSKTYLDLLFMPS